MNTTNGGLTFAGALQITLIVLKLTRIINCSWLIVLLPFELTIVIVTLSLIFIIWIMKG